MVNFRPLTRPPWRADIWRGLGRLSAVGFCFSMGPLGRCNLGSPWSQALVEQRASSLSIGHSACLLRSPPLGRDRFTHTCGCLRVTFSRCSH